MILHVPIEFFLPLPFIDPFAYNVRGFMELLMRPSVHLRSLIQKWGKNLSSNHKTSHIGTYQVGDNLIKVGVKGGATLGLKLPLKLVWLISRKLIELET